MGCIRDCPQAQVEEAIATNGRAANRVESNFMMDYLLVDLFSVG
jgi:hypothetical protein